ncbi:hypothetical protein SAMN04487881_1123 [Marinobacter sp. es.048]|uniref:hypothetical protein n=1 Tax=Marinobacter sp. es.048 TaxID=1761795 RepID=UPI000B75C4C3|nr:hypothetical protein [Marinobacter sp. es.048]SNC64694.1 hypothetical protein SAMN04487881_1123 [Marinobacter sp. es.048]
MRSRKDDRRIQRFMAWSAIILLTPWFLIAVLKAMEAVNDGVLDNGSLQVGLIAVIGLIFGALVFWVIPTWKARRSNR